MHVVSTVWLTVSMMVTCGRVPATAAAGSTVMVLISDLQQGFVADGLVQVAGVVAGVVAGEGEEHLVQRWLVYAHRGDGEAGLPEPDEHVGGGIGDFEGDGEPAGLWGQDRLLADDAADDLPG